MSKQEPRQIENVELANILNLDWELDAHGEDAVYSKSQLPNGKIAQMKMYNFRDSADPNKRECSIVYQDSKEEYIFIPRAEVLAGMDYKSGAIHIKAVAISANEQK